MVNVEEVLFGFDPTEGIVAVEPFTDSVRIYRRVQGGMVTEDHPFTRWLLTLDKVELENAHWTELEGNGFRFLAEFPNNSSYSSARFALRDAHIEHIAYPSAARQFLTLSGKTLYKGMGFDDIVRMQIDLETAGLDPHIADNSILLATISDNRGFETIIEGDEADILRAIVTCVQEHDPDVIEGHNIYGFDLPYMTARARRVGIRLSLGRDGSEPLYGAQQNCAIGYYSRPYIPVHIAGREVIDTLLAVQRWDVSRASLSSHGLKAVAQALGIAEVDREIIPHDQIASEWHSNPERVKKYALQDVRETRSLAEVICPPEFYLTQMVPDSYSRNATSGTGEKINYLFIREYLRNGKAIPQQSEPKPLPGGYTEVRNTGVIAPVVKCDVESLYPSLMLTRGIAPSSDTLGIFVPALRELTARRIDAKRHAKQSQGKECAYWDGVQASFKILINSFYGYLGGPFNFNDYSAAANVTTGGQAIVKTIIDELEKKDSLVIEIDTDGVYFRPPADVNSYEKEEHYVEQIGSVLPEGIRLAHDGRYQAMLSLKMKNYVLFTYDGKKIFKGSALRSRSDEPFGLEFISKATDYLLRGEKHNVKDLYESIAKSILEGKLPIVKFARRERVTEKTFTATGRKRIARAASNAKVGDYITIYEREDGSIALTEDYNNDENKQHLLEKLYKFACRLREAFGDDFDVLFPKPSKKTRSEAAGQQTLGLFD